MKKRNGISIFFVLGITALITISVTRKPDDKKASTVNPDNGSSFSRYGETFEDQMGVKTRPDSFTIPLTIVTAQPEVPAEAHITLGEQREVDITKSSSVKLSTYQRDIFLDYPREMILKGFSFTGFQATIKAKKNHPNPKLVDELQNLDLVLEHYVTIQINDGKRLPTKNIVFIQNDHPSNRGDEFALDLSIKDEAAKFNSKEKIKFTIDVFFRCTQMMVEHKATYKLALDDIPIFYSTVYGGQNLPHDLHVPYKNFFVIRCGEYVPTPN